MAVLHELKASDIQSKIAASLSMPSVSIAEIQSAVEENGLEFKMVKEQITQTLWKKLDEDQNEIVYYITPQYIHFDRPWSALLMYQGQQCFITGDTCTLSTIKKWLQNDTSCDICYEDRTDHGTCPRCGFKYCPVCTFHRGLDADFKFKSFVVESNVSIMLICPQCEAPIMIDAMNVYALVMDYLDELPTEHQKFVRHLANNDNEYQQKRFALKQKRLKIKNQFQKGDHVKIAGLKSRPEWNGKLGKIIGAMNDEKRRWPVQIIAGDKEYAWLQAKNLKIHKKAEHQSKKHKNRKKRRKR